MKKLADFLAGPVAKLLARLGVHPNALTLLGLALTAGVAWLYLVDLRLGALGLLAAGAFDTLDGQVARASGRATRFGAALDSTVDRITEFAIFGALLWRFKAQPAAALALFLSLAGAVLVSYARARGEGLGVSVKAGPMSRAARYFYLAAASFLPEPLFPWAMWGFATLVWLTFIRRLYKLYTLLSTPEGGLDSDG